MMVAVKNWSSSYKNKIKTRKYERQVEDLANIWKQKDNQEFFYSKLFLGSSRSFKCCKSHMKVNPAQNNLGYAEINLHLY